VGRTRAQVFGALFALSAAIYPAAAAASARSQQLYAKGLIPFQSQQWEAAYALFDEATAADPDDAVATYYRGLTAARLGRTQDAIADVERALQLRPDLRPAVLDLGVLYLDAGEYERAEAWLKRAYDLPESRFPAALFLGVTYFRRGKDTEAQTFLQAAAKDPRLRPAANYYEALSLLRTGERARADEMLRGTREAWPQTQIAVAIDEHLSSAPASAFAFAADESKAWTVHGDFGFAYDSNVSLAPNKSSIRKSRGIDSPADGEAQIAAGASYRVLDVPLAEGTVSYDLYQGFNFTRNDFNIGSHRFRFDVQTRADRWYQFGMSAYYNLYLRDFRSFFQEGVGIPWVTFYEGEVSATQLYYRVRGRDFFGSPFNPFRDSINNAVGARQYFLLGAVDRTLSVGYQWSDDDPLSRDGTDFAYSTHQFDIEVHSAVRDWFAATLGYAVLLDDYEHPNSRTGFRIGRYDNQHQIVLLLERPITPFLLAGINYLGTINNSNLDEFEYDRHVVSAGVRMHF